MLSYTRYVVSKAVLVPALLVLPALSTPSFAQHHAVVEWYADLSPARIPSRGAQALTVQTRATGKVAVDVDFPRKTVTFHVDAKGISGVGKIEVRADSSPGDLAGPTIFTLYDAHDGPFTGSLTKTVTGQAFEYVATQILNSRAGIVITTDKNPDGEITGQIVMHKRYE